jgi:hypothetical protein
MLSRKWQWHFLSKHRLWISTQPILPCGIAAASIAFGFPPRPVLACDLVAASIAFWGQRQASIALVYTQNALRETP